MELGLYSFAELVPDPVSGSRLSAGERLGEILEEIELADRVGLDVYGLGEHHRDDFAASSPAVVLAAAAARTRHIRLTSAVTVLSSADPVRVFQDFATLDLLSAGRAEIMAGRGAFTESFPLFGRDLADYDELFAGNLDLLLRVRQGGPINWTGKGRAPLHGEQVYPRPIHNPLPVWVGVGGTPASAGRAGSLGLPMGIGIIGGSVRRFAPLAQLYREAGRRAGHDVSRLRVGINSHGYVATSAEKAIDDTYPHFMAAMQTFLGRSVGQLPSRAEYAHELALDGALVAGSPQQVAQKIVYQHQLFGHDRFLMQISVGTMKHADVLASIERFGTEVAPIVRAELGPTD